MSEKPVRTNDAGTPGTKRQWSVHQPLPHVPRLSIGFGLLWTTATAGVLSLVARTGEFGHLRFAIHYVILVVSVAIMGWLLSGALLLVWHAARGTLWPTEPGEWLVLGAAGTLVLRKLEQIVYRLSGPQDPLSWLGIRSVSLEMCAFAPIAALFIAGAIAQRRRPWWAAALWAISFATLPEIMPVAMYPFVWTPPWAVYLGGVGLLLSLMTAGVISDWRRREPRHWLHWSGVLLFWLGSAFICVVMALIGAEILPVGD